MTSLKKSKPMTTIPRCLNFLTVDVLPKLIYENEIPKRKEYCVLLTRHLSNISKIIQARLRAKQQSRQDICRLVDTEWPSHEYEDDLLSESGWQGYLRVEEETDQRFLTILRDALHSKEVEIQMLQEAMDRRVIVEDGLFANETTTLPKATQDKIKLLENLIKKQNKDIALLQHQIEDQSLNYVFLPKDQYIEMNRRLHPLIPSRRTSVGTRTPNRQHSKSDMAVTLFEDVVNLIGQVERLRGRIQQTCNTINDHEFDKSVSLQVLSSEAECTSSLRSVVKEKVCDWNEERRNMEVEIGSLRENMDRLAVENAKLGAQNRKLKRQLDKLESNKVPPPTAASAEEGIKKALEKHQRKLSQAASSSNVASVELVLGGSTERSMSGSQSGSRPMSQRSHTRE